jgi:predicted anti-sigma-YlaC factor YlaD
VISRAQHLQEERLFECYLAERSGDAIDPPLAEHLADCASCAARYAELAGLMTDLRHEGEAEADALFTADRLRAQQQHIARRIAHVGRPARVISFPGQFVRRTIHASTSRSAPRWMAAAAAAGLFIGVALGASYEASYQGAHARTPLGSSAGQRYIARDVDPVHSSHLTPIATRGSSAADVAADDAFLSDLEVALERPHTSELQAFDALTPHVREVRDQR